MLSNRMIRAAQLDDSLYKEVEHDLSATSQALTVVILVSIASGVSGAIGMTLSGHPAQAVGGLIGGIVSGVIGWIVWSLITYFIGTSVFGGTATPGELLRTLGFADSPSILLIFGFLPVVGRLIGLVAAIWTLIAGVVAVRQALDFDTQKAILTVILGWVAMFVVAMVLGAFGLGVALFGL